MKKFTLLLFYIVSTTAHSQDSIIKKNSFVVGLNFGVAPFENDGLGQCSRCKIASDKIYKRPLLGLSVGYERKLKNTHYLLVNLAFFYGKSNGSFTSNYTEINGNFIESDVIVKRNFNYVNIELSYRKRWALNHSKSTLIILDAGINSVPFFVGNKTYNYNSFTNGVLTGNGSFLDNYNYNIFNTTDKYKKLNLSIVNRIGIEKKFKKKSIAILITNYISPTPYYEFSPKAFNPLLTLQLHV